MFHGILINFVGYNFLPFLLNLSCIFHLKHVHWVAVVIKPVSVKTNSGQMYLSGDL